MKFQKFNFIERKYMTYVVDEDSKEVIYVGINNEIATLINAAPDMLEALQSIVKHIDYSRLSENGKDVINNAETVINKATTCSTSS